MPLIDYGIHQRSFPGNPGAPNRPKPSDVHDRRVVYPSSKPVPVLFQADPSRHDAKNHAVGSSSRQGIGPSIKNV